MSSGCARSTVLRWLSEEPGSLVPIFPLCAPLYVFAVAIIHSALSSTCMPHFVLFPIYCALLTYVIPSNMKSIIAFWNAQLFDAIAGASNKIQCWLVMPSTHSIAHPLSIRSDQSYTLCIYMLYAHKVCTAHILLHIQSTKWKWWKRKLKWTGEKDNNKMPNIQRSVVSMCMVSNAIVYTCTKEIAKHRIRYYIELLSKI